MAENIVIPGQIYIGYSVRGAKDEEVLAFCTYYEDNAACRKRQATIDSWSNKSVGTDIIDNLPRKGYKLSKQVTHGGGWNDLNTYWRIVDPRGFELEITSGNVGKLFQYCTIDHGIIAEECVWGWDKGNQSKVVLLPVNSSIYLESQVSSDRHFAKSLALKDLKIGDRVHLKNDTRGIWFGKVTYGHFNHDTEDNQYGKVSFDQSYVILQEDSKNEYHDGNLYFVKTPAVIAAEDGDKAYTKEEAEKFLNAKLTEKHKHGSRMISVAGNSDTPYYTAFITYDDPKNCKAEFVYKEFTRDEFCDHIREVSKQNIRNSDIRDALSSMIYNYDILLVEKAGQQFMLHSPVDEQHRMYHNKPSVTPVGEFLHGNTNSLNMDCIEVFGPNDAMLGLKLNKNPKFDKDNRYSYNSRREEPMIMTPLEIFYGDKFIMVQIKFKDYISGIKSSRY